MRLFFLGYENAARDRYEVFVIIVTQLIVFIP